MTFDTRTIVLVVRRLHRLEQMPMLFNERMPPHRVLERTYRVMDWLGPCGLAVALSYIRRRELPTTGKREWKMSTGIRT